MGWRSRSVSCPDSGIIKAPHSFTLREFSAWASALVADGKVYIGDEDGDVVVLAAKGGSKAVVLSETNLGAQVYGSPIVANGMMYLMSQTHLFVVGADVKPLPADRGEGVEIKK